jgi:phosphate starvation-inducible membrane PsiE
VHARYHALMLIFLAAMAGFALTGDLFNFFVFFEVMSTVARVLPRIAHLALGWIFSGLDRLHDGIVSDYVAWLTLGLLVFGGVIALR